MAAWVVWASLQTSPPPVLGRARCRTAGPAGGARALAAGPGRVAGASRPSPGSAAGMSSAWHAPATDSPNGCSPPGSAWSWTRRRSSALPARESAGGSTRPGDGWWINEADPPLARPARRTWSAGRRRDRTPGLLRRRRPGGRDHQHSRLHRPGPGLGIDAVRRAHRGRSCRTSRVWPDCPTIPVHAFLREAFEYRIDQVREARPPRGPLPAG